MRFFLKNPKTKMEDPLLTIAVLAGVASIIKFLLDGVTLVIHGHTLGFGHTDSFSYSSILAPTLGAHSYTHVKADPYTELKGTQNVDSPDA